MITLSTTTFESTATYSCNTGYNIVGSVIRTCGASITSGPTGVWSPAAPVCESMLYQCVVASRDFLYRIAGNFRGGKIFIIFVGRLTSTKFYRSVAYLNVGMPCSHEAKRNFLLTKSTVSRVERIFYPTKLTR